MSSDEVIDLLLFVSRASKTSSACKTLFDQRGVTVSNIHVDHPTVRRRVLENPFLKITHVPTLVLVYRDQSVMKLTGMDDIMGWLDENHPPPITDADGTEILEEDPSHFIPPPQPARRDGHPITPVLGTEEGFEQLDPDQFNQQYFESDTVFHSPEERQQQPEGFSRLDARSIQRMAEEMRAGSGLSHE